MIVLFNPRTPRRRRNGGMADQAKAVGFAAIFGAVAGLAGAIGSRSSTLAGDRGIANLKGLVYGGAALASVTAIAAWLSDQS